jgi:hypothetical protein
MQEGQKIGQLPVEDQAKARLMVDLEKDVLLQWIGLIYLTLEEMGVQKVDGPSTAFPVASVALLEKRKNKKTCNKICKRCIIN